MQDDFILYVETEEEEIEKPRYNLTGDAREALQEYYDAVHLLCEAQTNFAKSTQVLEQKIEDKSIFLSIIQQVQLPAVQVQVRMVEEMEKLEGKMYRELMLSQHLLNFRAIHPNTTEQTRTMAVYIYFVLYQQITGLKPSQTGCAIAIWTFFQLHSLTMFATHRHSTAFVNHVFSPTANKQTDI